MSDDEKGEKLYRVETVPPPAGESDAYNAPTRVGPMAAAVVAEMMKAAEHAGIVARDPKAAAAPPDASPGSQRSKGGDAPIRVREEVAPRSGRADTRAEGEPAVVPRLADVYEPAGEDEDEDEDKAATMVSPLAKPPAADAVPPSTGQRATIDMPPPSSSGALAPPSAAGLAQAPQPQAEAPNRSWIDVLLVLVILGAAGAAIYLLRR